MSTQIIAHRGASKLAPENTLPAFQLAYELGAEGIETDVQLTKDQIPVLMHDEGLKRTTNGYGYLKDYTYKELKQLDAGSWFSSSFTGTKLLSLEELLSWIKDKPLYLNIELKNNKIDYTNLEKIVYTMLNDYQLLNRTTLSTFNPKSIKRMKKLDKQIESALLTSRRRKDLVTYAKSLGASAIHVKYRLLSRKLVDNCQREGIAIRIYTVNKALRIKRCFNLNCDGIFTDVPGDAHHIKLGGSK
ncbi:glycerophosphodiester phosphodiesterase [Virgibacillus phasianinus]|uniref:Glycerophosphodiester phosphodiesterase n=1 Tax=Virgibacillus phasianinus TaxID=2017483 RepID=A0A220U613_9BACI|nr:glycerophosphodiester phosphodiesterase [Virgibacillus phasianinus]ASK63271.1 glycerophosphodiester phosphodiesterase [Virgibacillus phasianinus]